MGGGPGLSRPRLTFYGLEPAAESRAGPARHTQAGSRRNLGVILCHPARAGRLSAGAGRPSGSASRTPRPRGAPFCGTRESWGRGAEDSAGGHEARGDPPVALGRLGQVRLPAAGVRGRVVAGSGEGRPSRGPAWWRALPEPPEAPPSLGWRSAVKPSAGLAVTLAVPSSSCRSWGPPSRGTQPQRAAGQPGRGCGGGGGRLVTAWHVLSLSWRRQLQTSSVLPSGPVSMPLEGVNSAGLWPRVLRSVPVSLPGRGQGPALQRTVPLEVVWGAPSPRGIRSGVRSPLRALPRRQWSPRQGPGTRGEGSVSETFLFLLER